MPEAAHEVIAEHLRALVAKRRPGDRLPGDRELSEQFQVSRMTARQAVATLVAEGAVYRVTGSGTFVARRPLHRRAARLLSFTEHMRRQGREPSSRIVDLTERAATLEEATELRLPPGALLTQLRRVLLGDGVPLAVEDLLIATDPTRALSRQQGLAEVDAALAVPGGTPVRSRGTLTGESASPELARLLDVAVGAALIVHRHRLVDASDRTLHLSTVRYVGERTVFDIDQERPTPGSPEPSYEVRALP